MSDTTRKWNSRSLLVTLIIILVCEINLLHGLITATAWAEVMIFTIGAYGLKRSVQEYRGNP